MPTTYRGAVSLSVRLSEILETATGTVLTHSNVGQVRESQSMSSTTTPASNSGSYDTKALSSGALTVDLTAVTSTYMATKDFTGSRVHTIAVYAHSTNSGALTVDVGASNGYNIGGDSGFSASVAPGGTLFLKSYGGTGSPAVSASAKDIDFAGTGTDGFDLLLIGD